MKLSDFDFELPQELIAQNPLSNRSDSKLMVLDRKRGTIEHRYIRDLPDILDRNDLLVFNQSRVIAARLRGNIEEKSVEILLHEPTEEATWECLTKPGKRFKLGSSIDFGKDLKGEVTRIQEDGSRLIKFSKSGVELDELIEQMGETPLPPYIKNSSAPKERYQTVYAKEKGSVAAPTAGLHFDQALLERLEEIGIKQEFVTLHVGRGTFEPVKGESIADHTMHYERYHISEETAKTLNHEKEIGKRIIAIGTTSVRTLEAAHKNGKINAGAGRTNLFITPGYQFQFVDALLTNFHLPKSTLLMLVSALSGYEFMQKAYQEAISKNYRFFSFGDAMLIL